MKENFLNEKEKEKGKLYIQTEMYMKEDSARVFMKEKENILGQKKEKIMEKCMKENGRKEGLKENVKLYTQTEMFMKEISTRVFMKEKENIFGQKKEKIMEKCMKENGKKGKEKEKGNYFVLVVEIIMKAILDKIFLKEMGNMFGQKMVNGQQTYMKENGRKEIWKDKEN
jgi:hypothetical protein